MCESTHCMKLHTICKWCVKSVWNYTPVYEITQSMQITQFSEINFEDDDDGPRIILPEPNSIPAVCWVYFQKKGFALQKDSIFPAQRFTARNNILRRMILQGSSPIRPMHLQFLSALLCYLLLWWNLYFHIKGWWSTLTVRLTVRKCVFLRVTFWYFSYILCKSVLKRKELRDDLTTAFLVFLSISKIYSRLWFLLVRLVLMRRLGPYLIFVSLFYSDKILVLKILHPKHWKTPTYM